MSLLVSLPFLLEHGRGLSAAQVGMMILPMPIGIGLTSPLAGRFADKTWSGWMSMAGLALLAAMLTAIAALLATGMPLWIMAICIAASGCGFGLFQAPNNNVMLRTAPMDRSGAAGGMLAQCRLIGQTAGALIAAMVLFLRGPLSVAAILVGAACAILSASFAARRSSRSGRPVRT